LRALAIDTATEVCSIALGDGSTMLAEDVFHAGRKHLEMLLPSIYRLLETRQMHVHDLDALVVGTGPGTFSGLRVGIATARGLAQAIAKPLLAAGSLDALAQGIGKCDAGAEHILPVIDAKRGQVFSRLFRRQAEGSLAPLSEIICADPQDLITQVAARAGESVLAGGNGVTAHFPVFAQAPSILPLPVDHPGHNIRAAFHLSALSLPAGTGDYSLENLTRVLPTYIREPDADKTILLRKRAPWLT